MIILIKNDVVIGDNIDMRMLDEAELVVESIELVSLKQ